jgi:serine/threonine protein kinase
VRNLISRILETEPTKRYTLEDIRRHAWYSAVRDADVPREESTGDASMDFPLYHVIICTSSDTPYAVSYPST